MGYEVFIQKFENGESETISFEELNNALSKHGEIIEGNFGLEFVSSDNDLFDRAPLSGSTKSEITGISFDRPAIQNVKFSEIIFDLLEIENTCFFGPDLEYMQSRSQMTEHLPDSLKEHFQEGPEVIQDARESWPFN